MIGEQLRTLRTANRMTQKELAGELSVAFQTISNWENNSIDPSVNMILRIAEYFNCSAASDVYKRQGILTHHC